MQINPSKLRSIRARLDLNQKTMAKIIGKTEATYSRKENLEAPFTLSEAKDITDYINKLIREDDPWVKKMHIEDIFF